MTRSKIAGMISSVRGKFVQNMVRIVKNVCEKTVVHVSSQLRWRGIIGGVQTKPGSTSYGCFETLLIGRTGRTPPCQWCIQQLGEDDCLVDVSQRVFAHAVVAQQFHGVQRLSALADNGYGSWTCSPAKRWFGMVDTKHLNATHDVTWYTMQLQGISKAITISLWLLST